MTQTFPNSIKATVLQVMGKYSRRFNSAGKELNFKVLDTNPVNDTFNLEITPEDSANMVSPLLTRFKTAPSSVDNEKQPLSESKIKINTFLLHYIK